jgi:hypothetical protein
MSSKTLDLLAKILAKAVGVALRDVLMGRVDEPTGSQVHEWRPRPNYRAAGSAGYWKATGTDKAILSTPTGENIGVKKALVFYGGKPPKGTKTDWIMHEYRLTGANCRNTTKRRGSSAMRVRICSLLPPSYEF